jgi:hypothetical protein
MVRDDFEIVKSLRMDKKVVYEHDEGNVKYFPIDTLDADIENWLSIYIEGYNQGYKHGEILGGFRVQNTIIRALGLEQTINEILDKRLDD